MGGHTSDGLTVLVQGLPPETGEDDVARFFNARVGPSGSVISKNGIGTIAPEVNRSTKLTTVTFVKHEFKAKALRDCNGISFSAQWGDGSVIVNVKDDFDGLTTLHCPERVNIDREGIKETCWLRDELPGFLEGQAGKSLRPRVMSYGYNANIWVNAPVDGLDTPVANLVRWLDLERKQDPNRPLIFIGHSLGGIVVKQVVNEMITRYKQIDPNYISPIKACLFLAVPHRGTGNANVFGDFLRAISKVSLPGLRPNTSNLKDLERKNKKLADITDRFIQILNANNIQIISCYEDRPYSAAKGQIVSKNSAILEYAGMTKFPIGIDANHSDVAKFGSASQHPFVQIASELAEISDQALHDRTPYDPTPQVSALGLEQSAQHEVSNHMRGPSPSVTERLQPGSEPAFFKLTRYTTIFLIDDSSSMENIPEHGIHSWDETISALAKCAQLILGAGGRVKVHFFNSPKVKENISGVQDLIDFCSGMTPKGDTPTYQKLKLHLDVFMEGFQRLTVQQREDHPGLNLVIFTDGAPEGRFDDIEEVIVETAQDLDAMRADKYKLGIQWVQIGNDKKVADFFDKIDDKIKGAHQLRRDIVDTTRYNPQSATERTYKKIVLGAIDKDWDDEATTAAADGPSNQSQEPRYTPHIPQGRASRDLFSSQQVHAMQRTELGISRQYTH